jgi:hypothetical protein
VIKLLAFEPGDGYAFAQTGDQIFSLRPPYDSHLITTVSISTVVTAVTTYDFTYSEKTFDDWPDLVDFLRQGITKDRQDRGQPLPKEGIGVALLQYAPSSTIHRYLKRIQDELTPSKEYAAAENILVQILKHATVVHANKPLRDLAESLLTETRSRRKNKQERKSED